MPKEKLLYYGDNGRSTLIKIKCIGFALKSQRAHKGFK